LKDILKKILYGFLFGIGLSLAALLIGYITYEATKPGSGLIYKRYDKTAGLIISNEHNRKITDGVIVLGTIENNGSETWRFLKIEAEIFDKEGVFIDECSDTVDTIISPNEKENFKIKCGACKSNKIPDFGKITTRIKDATNVPKNEEEFRDSIVR